MNHIFQEKYKELGISKEVYEFGEKIEQELKPRFEEIDARAEINQLKQLVADIRQKKIPLYCPHGRPVIITITKKELEKQFGR